ncbi:MAG: gliding motility protein GldM [Chitinophagales bacterium]|nr:gliding motility protein GldM [Chitinophagales bacterium]
MAHAQLTPRQKMINMLYLVLTAILALNVSNEVLDAFKGVNDGITTSNLSLSEKNNNTYADFQRQYAIDSGRAKAAFENALKARELSRQLYQLLETYKQQMIAEAGGIDEATGKILRDDNIDIATRLFVENNGAIGKQLQQQIESTRQQLIGLMPEQEQIAAQKTFALKIETPTNDRAWEFATFNHVPVVAAVTTLTKFQNDVLNAENHIVESLYGSVYAKTEKVDKMEAIVSSPSALVMQGEQYKADVLVAASNSTLTPEVFIGSFTPTVKKGKDGKYETIESASEQVPLQNPVKVDVSGGVGKLQLGSSAVGNKKYYGVVRVKSSTDNTYKFFPFEGEYRVSPKTAVVSPTMMNVMYIGLDNPVEVSVPGVPQQDVTATINHGTLTKNADGSYNARISEKKNATITIKAKVNGKEMVMGEQSFRVKRIPTPQSTVDGVVKPINVSAQVIKNSRSIIAKVEAFDYPVQFRVLSFTCSYRNKNGELFKETNTGTEFNEKIKVWLKNIDRGEAIFFDDIVVMGPDMERRTTNALAFNITSK